MTDQIRPAEYGRPAREAGLGFLNRYQNSIDWVLQEFGSHGSADLELESTIIYVDREAAKKIGDAIDRAAGPTRAGCKVTFRRRLHSREGVPAYSKGLLRASTASTSAHE
jgi:hypothetical protein